MAGRRRADRTEARAASTTDRGPQCQKQRSGRVNRELRPVHRQPPSSKKIDTEL